jgi:hypothetical protein
MPIESAWIDAEMIKMKNLEEFFEIDNTSDKDYEYTVAWIDCMATGEDRGRGIFIRGNHARGGDIRRDFKKQKGEIIKMPIDAPSFSLNKLSVKAFNFAYYNKQFAKLKMVRQGFDPFFYPLDSVGEWNRIYGKKGFLQYQCIIPTHRIDDLKQLFDVIAKSGQGSFLAVLKRFGTMKSPGLMSFPQPGYTLALDFKNLGNKSAALFAELDKIVLRSGGRLYPAKDALMSAMTFQTSYPQWQDFEKFVDPRFTSMFWERVSKRV